MRRVLIGFVVFLLAVVALSAILSPPAYWMCDHFFPNTFPFRRVFNRMLMISALAMLYPLARFWRIDSWGKVGIRDVFWWKHWLVGLFIGCVSIGALFWILSYSQYTYSLQVSLGKFLKILIGAVLVGLLEEILFRGMFFLALRELIGRWISLWAVIMSGFFAKTHFIKATDIDAPVNWLSGWTMWGHVWPSWSQMPHLFIQGMNLFLVGLVLCAVVWKMKSLWFAMGLHTGWVVFILTVSHNKNPLDSWLTVIFLMVILFYFLKKGSDPKKVRTPPKSI